MPLLLVAMPLLLVEDIRTLCCSTDASLHLQAPAKLRMPCKGTQRRNRRLAARPQKQQKRVAQTEERLAVDSVTSKETKMPPHC